MGRKLRNGSSDWGWNVCVNTIKTHCTKNLKKANRKSKTLMLLMRFAKASETAAQKSSSIFPALAECWRRGVGREASASLACFQAVGLWLCEGLRTDDQSPTSRPPAQTCLRKRKMARGGSTPWVSGLWVPGAVQVAPAALGATSLLRQR